MKNRKEIRKWMIDQDLNSVQIALTLNISRGAVCHWLAGRMTSRRIEDYLESMGCPREYLGQEEREAA
jgi:predicted transcriptional regulator